MNPPVLILDDSLSAVDAETVEHILENMQKCPSRLNKYYYCTQNECGEPC